MSTEDTNPPETAQDWRSRAPRMDLDAVRRLCDAATPGPWGISDSEMWGIVQLGEFADGSIRYGDDVVECIGPETDRAVQADAAFIAAARELVPALADEVERLQADIVALLPAAKLYLQALDDDPEHEYLTLPEAMLVTALRDAVARHAESPGGAR